MDGFSDVPAVRSRETAPALSNGADVDPFGIRQILVTLRRRASLIALTLAGVAAATIAVAMVQPPRYEAKALMMISPQQQRPLSQSNDTSRPPADPNFINSQVLMIKSRAMAERLVDSLNLMADPEWSAGPAGVKRTRPEVVRAVMRTLDARHENQTYVVEAIAHSRSPDKAAKMANGLADAYIASQREARLQSASRTGQWLSTQLDQLRNDLQQREAAVEKYRASTGLLTADGVPLTEHQITNAEAAVMGAQVEVAEKQARYQQLEAIIRSSGSPDTLAGALPSSETLVQLRSKQADAKRGLADLLSKYGERHPSVVSSRDEITSLDGQIQAEIGRQASYLANDANIARARLATLQGGLGAVKGRLVANNSSLVHLRQLERESAAARTIYENVLQRFRELETGADSFGADAQLVSAAAPPPPMSRIPSFGVLAMAIGLGLALGVLVALIADQMHQTLGGSDDIELKIGLPVLTSIPALRSRDFRGLPKAASNPAGVVVARPMSAFTESFRVLRSRLAYVKGDRKTRIAAVTSALPGEGKSNTALALARVAALSGQKAIVLDCDLRRCSLNLLLGIAPETGLTQVLSGEQRWQDVTGRDEASGADVLPASSDSFTATDLFGSEAMVALLNELSRNYDLVVLDCPPVLTLAEARTLAVLADAVVVVARNGKTPVYALRTAITQLESTGANILGVAFNGVDRKAPGRMSYSDPLYFSQAQRGLYGA
jgi:capsular exopolysaccharide synthesis family protein